MALNLLTRDPVEAAKAAIVRLTARLENQERLAAHARNAHREAALDAEAGDKAAVTKAAKSKAGLAAALADVEDTGAMIEAARERLARAEAQAERERIAKAWQATADLCAKRDALAKRVEEQAAAILATFEELCALDDNLVTAMPVRVRNHAGVGRHQLTMALHEHFAEAGKPHRLFTGLGAGPFHAGPGFVKRVENGSAIALAQREAA